MFQHAYFSNLPWFCHFFFKTRKATSRNITVQTTAVTKMDPTTAPARFPQLWAFTDGTTATASDRIKASREISSMMRIKLRSARSEFFAQAVCVRKRECADEVQETQSEPTQYKCLVNISVIILFRSTPEKLFITPATLSLGPSIQE